MNVNTVLANVAWEAIEPQEGVFDFSLFDKLLRDARQHGLRLILLWFGAFKNGDYSEIVVLSSKVLIVMQQSLHTRRRG